MTIFEILGRRRIFTTVYFLNYDVEEEAKDRKKGQAVLGDHELTEQAIALASEVNVVKLSATKALHYVFVADVLVDEDLSLIALLFVFLDELIHLYFYFLRFPDRLQLVGDVAIRYTINRLIPELSIRKLQDMLTLCKPCLQQSLLIS